MISALMNCLGMCHNRYLVARSDDEVFAIRGLTVLGAWTECMSWPPCCPVCGGDMKLEDDQPRIVTGDGQLLSLPNTDLRGSAWN